MRNGDFDESLAAMSAIIVAGLASADRARAQTDDAMCDRAVGMAQRIIGRCRTLAEVERENNGK